MPANDDRSCPSKMNQESEIMKLNLSKMDSPLGALLVVTDSQDLLRALDFADHHARLRRLLREHYGECDVAEASPPRIVADCLRNYFGGQLNALDNINV